jgi:hypothetical protein
MGDPPKGSEIQSSNDAGGISIGVIIGAIGGIIGIVGVIVGAVFYCRRHASNSKPQKPVVNELLNTTDNEAENNAPSTPRRHPEYGPIPESPEYPTSPLSFRSSHTTCTSPNTSNPNQGSTSFPMYKEPDDRSQGDSETPHIPYQPSAPCNSENQQHRPSQSQQSPQQYKNTQSSYKAHSSLPSQTPLPKISYHHHHHHHHQQQQQQHQEQRQQTPPSPGPASIPSYKDQCREVLKGREEGDMVGEATPVMVVYSTPMVTDGHSVTSNHTNSCSGTSSKLRRSALDP